MTHAAEPTMQEQLWTWLESQGLKVYGEVKLQNGIIDLICHDIKNDQFIGVELKNHGGSPSRIQHPAVDEQNTPDDLTESERSQIYARKYWPQLIKYATSDQLDKLYFACQDPVSVIDLEEGAKEDLHSKYDDIPLGPDEIGQIRVPDPFSSTEPIEILSESAVIQRTDIPEIRYDDEQTVQHYIWEEVGGIREGVLPNRENRTVRRIDIIQFTGEQHPTDVYKNQAEQDIIGVEAKGANAVRKDREEIQRQLMSYLDSGGLTKLYLGVPEGVKSEALKLLNITGPDRLSDVGLYTVNETGDTIKQQPAAKQTLYFDGIRENTSKNYSYIIDIGWGRSNPNLRTQKKNEYYSVFDRLRRGDRCY